MKVINFPIGEINVHWLAFIEFYPPPFRPRINVSKICLTILARRYRNCVLRLVINSAFKLLHTVVKTIKVPAPAVGAPIQGINSLWNYKHLMVGWLYIPLRYSNA